MATRAPAATRPVAVKRLLARTGIVLLWALGIAAAPALGGSDYYAPVETPLAFDFDSAAPFEDYLDATAAHLREHRAFIKPLNTVRELELVMPFEYARPANCTGPVKAILLVHGILDTPYAMREFADQLNDHCFLVRSILLPGHGTRPGDLLTVTADEWLAAVDYGVRTLKRDADSIYVGGFSLGGLLAAHAALDDASIRGVVLLAPALRIPYQLLADQSLWLRHLKDWLDRNPAPLPVRYQSMSTNAVAQVIRLIDSYDEKVAAGFRTPAFVASSVDDIAVQGEDVIEEFFEHFRHPASVLEVYGDYAGSDDKRLRVLPAFLPGKKILNMAHVAIPFRHDDHYFGEQGTYRDCGQYLPTIPTREVAACQRSDDNWKGELGSSDDDRYRPLQRLTYNPYFDETMKRVLAFLASIEANGDTGDRFQDIE